jgi:hypothetical protein
VAVQLKARRFAPNAALLAPSKLAQTMKEYADLQPRLQLWTQALISNWLTQTQVKGAQPFNEDERVQRYIAA